MKPPKENTNLKFCIANFYKLRAGTTHDPTGNNYL